MSTIETMKPRKTSKTFYDCICYFIIIILFYYKNHFSILIIFKKKKKRVLEVLEPITAFHANRDRYSGIYRAFIVVYIAES